MQNKIFCGSLVCIVSEAMVSMREAACGPAGYSRLKQPVLRKFSGRMNAAAEEN
ncbi:MAG: hypothetical protein Q4E91_01195 [Lachnospiraceae bacterium]|nr:hypothetical protein [Lachnospiraceae bacterium]